MKAVPLLHPTRLAQRPTPGGQGQNFRVRGFTLVEVLLAMVLTAILMTAMMGIASSSMQDRRRLAEREHEAEPAWLDQLARQIETDLLMGTGVSASRPSQTPGGGTCLYILTQASIGRSPGMANLPVLVSYRLVQSDQGGVLLREQKPLTKSEGVTSTASQTTATQIVAAGIESVQVGGTTLLAENNTQRPRSLEARANAAFTILVDNRPVAMQPVQPQVRLVINTQELTTGGRTAPEELSRTYERTLLTR